MEFDEKEKKFLLDVARKSIEHYFKTGEVLDIEANQIPSKRMVEDGASFVTFYIDKVVRGCMGSLEPKRPLCFDVRQNALKAAFSDQKFKELKPEELKKIKITISILTNLEKLKVKNWQDALKKIVPKKHGVIIRNLLHVATYLPDVWNELPDKNDFLSELSERAGIGRDGWKDKNTEFFVYEAFEFSE